MLELVSALGVTGVILVITTYLLWKKSVENKVIAEKHEIVVQSLEKRLEQQNEQINLLSDRTPIDSEQLLRDGSF